MGARKNQSINIKQEKLSQVETQDGTFYSRKSVDRSNDIVAAIRGELGEYAYPGDNKPSVFFRVSILVHKEHDGNALRIPVIFFEVAEHGHEFQTKNRIIDPNTFLPCSTVERHGEAFRSQLKDSLSRTAQEHMCHYLARELQAISKEQEPVKISKNETAAFPETVEEMYNRSNHDLIGILEEIPGLYGVKTKNGIVVFELLYGTKGGITVCASNDQRLKPERVFLFVYLLRHKKIERRVNEEMYTHQLAMWNFLREHLAQELAAEERHIAKFKTKVMEKQTDKQHGKKDNSAVPQKGELENARRNFISIAVAATGRLGYVDLSGDEGDLVVESCMVKNEHMIRVELVSVNHPLRLVGVEKDTCVFAVQLRNGKIGQVARKRLSPEQLRKFNTFIAFIVKKMVAAGIKLIPEKSKTKVT